MLIYTIWRMALCGHVLFVANDESEVKCICVYYEGYTKCMRSLTIHILFNCLSTSNYVGYSNYQS